jgi:hypothetical protein
LNTGFGFRGELLDATPVSGGALHPVDAVWAGTGLGRSRLVGVEAEGGGALATGVLPTASPHHASKFLTTEFYVKIKKYGAVSK